MNYLDKPLSLMRRLVPQRGAVAGTRGKKHAGSAQTLDALVGWEARASSRDGEIRSGILHVPNGEPVMGLIVARDKLKEINTIAAWNTAEQPDGPHKPTATERSPSATGFDAPLNRQLGFKLIHLHRNQLFIEFVFLRDGKILGINKHFRFELAPGVTTQQAELIMHLLNESVVQLREFSQP
jgi:hypothetical protein